MTRKEIVYSDVFGYGWETMKANFGYFVGLGLIYIIVLYLPAICQWIVGYSGLSGLTLMYVNYAFQIISHVVGIVLSIGIIKIALGFLDGYKLPMLTLIDSFDCFWRYWGAAILYGLIVFGGYLLFVVPGIVWAVKFSLFRYFVIDKDMGPIEALKASAEASKGVKWELFGLGVLSVLLMLAGLLCLGVGTFLTYPTIVIAQALVYRQLAAQTELLVEPVESYSQSSQPI